MRFYLKIIACFWYITAPAQSIRAYFNQPVDNTLCATADAHYTPHVEDTIAAYINQATASLEIAIYDNTSTLIMNAINAAANRGVQVRYITNQSSNVNGLQANIPTVKRNDGLTTNKVHDKFAVIDANLPTKAFIITGSMNWKENSIQQDYNNVVYVKSYSIAQAYLGEFNEMWAGRFGANKTNTTTSMHTVDNSIVEVYFSPIQPTTSKIQQALATAQQAAYVGVFTITKNELGNAIIDLKNANKTVAVITENIDPVLYFGNEYNNLVNAGVNTLAHNTIAGYFHHKYAIVDPFQASTAKVITGSHNWTVSAANEFDENTLIIHNPRIAQEYYEEFATRYQQLTASIIDASILDFKASVNNHSELEILLSTSLQNLEIQVIDLQGKILKTNTIKDENTTINIQDIPSGMYVVGIYNNKKLVAIQKIILP